MADTVATQTIYSGINRKTLVFTNLSDGTGESGVTKVDISALSGAPSKVRINYLSWSCEGMAVQVLFDHNADDLAIVLGGHGEHDFRPWGGYHDPASAGGTGDILFTTSGHTAGDSYSILMEIEW